MPCSTEMQCHVAQLRMLTFAIIFIFLVCRPFGSLDPFPSGGMPSDYIWPERCCPAYVLSCPVNAMAGSCCCHTWDEICALACCSKGLSATCRLLYGPQIKDFLHMQTLLQCMSKVALQAGRKTDSGNMNWADLKRLHLLSSASKTCQLRRTRSFFVHFGLNRLGSADPRERDKAKCLWEGYMWIVFDWFMLDETTTMTV